MLPGSSDSGLQYKIFNSGSISPLPLFYQLERALLFPRMAAATTSNNSNVRVGSSTHPSAENDDSENHVDTQTSQKEEIAATKSTLVTANQETPERVELLVEHDLGMCILTYPTVWLLLMTCSATGKPI